MASIQELGITHNDLKSANILLEQVKISPGRYLLRGFNFIIFLKKNDLMTMNNIKVLFVTLD